MNIETIKIIFLVLAISFLIGTFHPCDICGGFWMPKRDTRSVHPTFDTFIQIVTEDGITHRYCMKCVAAGLEYAAREARKKSTGEIR